MPLSDTPEAAALRRQNYSDYIQDQLQQERTTGDHAAVLKSRGPARISQMRAARVAASLPANPSSQDDDISHYHVVERMLDEQAYYPPHDKRTESLDYAAVHKQMTIIDDQRCLVCGVRHSTLGDPDQNPFGAVQLETHHHTIEWALANAIDPDKFNQHIRPGLQRLAAARPAGLSPLYVKFDAAYAAPMDVKTIQDWVDHGFDNLWVLCDVHHRHKFVGIHAITFPIWGPQDVVNQDSITHAIAEAKNAGTANV
jgi:hypothetical protein